MDSPDIVTVESERDVKTDVTPLVVIVDFVIIEDKTCVEFKDVTIPEIADEGMIEDTEVLEGEIEVGMPTDVVNELVPVVETMDEVPKVPVPVNMAVELKPEEIPVLLEGTVVDEIVGREMTEPLVTLDERVTEERLVELRSVVLLKIVTVTVDDSVSESVPVMKMTEVKVEASKVSVGGGGRRPTSV